MNVTIGMRINDLLIDKEMTVAQLGKMTGIARSKLSMIKNEYIDTNNGKPRALSPDELIAVAKALDVSPAFLLTGYDDENYTIGEELGLSNETVNRLKDMKNGMVKQVIDILVSDWSILMHLYEYLKSDFKNVQRVYIKDEKALTDWFPVEELSGFDRNDFERVNRLRLLDDLQRIREENKGGKEK